jgi:predicted transcriptional regulator
MVKMTFALDEATAVEIRRTADRLGIAQSHVVREAIAEYAARTDRVSERERLRTVTILETLREAPTSRPSSAVDNELRAIRAARRTGGRRSAR